MMKPAAKRALVMAYPILCGLFVGVLFGAIARDEYHFGWDVGFFFGLIAYVVVRYLVHISNVDLAKMIVFGAPAVVFDEQFDRGLKELVRNVMSDVEPPRLPPKNE